MKLFFSGHNLSTLRWRWKVVHISVVAPYVECRRATLAVVGQSCNLLRRYAVLRKQSKKVVEWNTCAGWLGRYWWRTC